MGNTEGHCQDIGINSKMSQRELQRVEVCTGLHRLSTDDEGMAVNTLWVTDCRGRKLSNQQAELLAERVGDFVVYCTPDSKVSPCPLAS